jgi:hypothetical protein
MFKVWLFFVFIKNSSISLYSFCPIISFFRCLTFSSSSLKFMMQKLNYCILYLFINLLLLSLLLINLIMLYTHPFSGILRYCLQDSSLSLSCVLIILLCFHSCICKVCISKYLHKSGTIKWNSQKYFVCSLPLSCLNFRKIFFSNYDYN